MHTHSTASDGSDTPGQLVEKAAKKGLRAIALTDHDTLGGLGEAQAAAKDLNIDFVRGCEVSTSTEHGSIHILGLWLPENSEILENFLAHLLERRNERNMRMLDKLRAEGIELSVEELSEEAKGSIGRPHMAKALVKKGYVRDLGEAFGKYLGINGSAYVPKVAPRPEQACKLLSDLGATVVMAHPLLRPVPDGWIEQMITGLAHNGLCALEVYHSEQDRAKMERLASLANKENLAISGGSDYHGRFKNGLKMGCAYGGMPIPESIYDGLLEQRRQKGLPV